MPQPITVKLRIRPRWQRVLRVPITVAEFMLLGFPLLSSVRTAWKLAWL